MRFGERAKDECELHRACFFFLASPPRSLCLSLLILVVEGQKVRSGAVHQRQLVTPLGIEHKFHSVM